MATFSVLVEMNYLQYSFSKSITSGLYTAHTHIFIFLILKIVASWIRFSDILEDCTSPSGT